MGQFVQDGNRILFETVIQVDQVADHITIGTDADDLDGLNFLSGKTMDFVNKKAFQGTMLAHTDGQRTEPDRNAAGYDALLLRIYGLFL